MHAVTWQGIYLWTIIFRHSVFLKNICLNLSVITYLVGEVIGIASRKSEVAIVYLSHAGLKTEPTSTTRRNENMIFLAKWMLSFCRIVAIQKYLDYQFTLSH